MKDPIWDAARAVAFDVLDKEEAEATANAEDLYSFIPRVSPGYEPPLHLAPVVEALTKASEEQVCVVISTPPRHTKTFTILHWIVWTIGRMPNTRIAYATFNKERANEVSKDAMSIAERAGIEFESSNRSVWRTKNGSRVMWGGLGGTWTGHGFNIIVIDDPIKNRAEVDSALIRERTDNAIRSVLMTRQEPGSRGTSIIVNMARWHPDDPAGRLVRDGWPYINLQAISPSGEVLWPSGFDLARLQETEARIGPYEFGAQYQGEPRQKGATVFGEPHYYDVLPTAGYSISGGLDFAYTSNTWSDFSVLVVLWAHAGTYYVVDVIRMRAETPLFKREVLAAARRQGLNQSARNPGLNAYIGGTEKGILDLLRSPDGTAPLYVTAINASGAGDKFARAQPAAAAWNAGKVLLPRNMAALGRLGAHMRAGADEAVPWVAAFVDEVCNFTGVSDPHDDQVDALAGAFVPFIQTPTTRNLRNLPPA